MSHPVRTHNPEGLHTPTGYSHIAWGTGRMIAVAGQVGLDEHGELAGPDAASQARQIFVNISRCLEAAGATFADVVKFGYFLTDITDLPAIRAAREEFVPADRLPAGTAVQVAALFRPDLRMEIEAWAVVPADRT